MKKFNINILFIFVLILLPFSYSLSLCGNGILDENEFCDPLLVSCCNSTCSGYYDIINIEFLNNQSNINCFNFDNTIIIDNDSEEIGEDGPLLVNMNNIYSLKWLFLDIPKGSSPYFSSGSPILITPDIINNNVSLLDILSTEVFFNANGVYHIALEITTHSCGVYFSNTLVAYVGDCCGNGVLDVNEQCDFSIDNTVCCNIETCTFASKGTSCDQDVMDECTNSFACNDRGECISEQNLPFVVTQPLNTSIVDNLCSSDIQKFTFPITITDPDFTPGQYRFEFNVTSVFPHQHQIYYDNLFQYQLRDRTFIIKNVTFDSLTITPTVEMIGGGNLTFTLTIVDPCELAQTFTYSVTRQCCGNMVLNTGEACDDGNLLDGDYCASNCSAVTGYCGDAIVQSNEKCDFLLQHCCGPTCQSILPATSICRNAHGDCDVSEYCTGRTPDCPADLFANSSVVCRQSAGPCDAPETCSGNHPLCPSENVVYPSTFLCRESKGICDPPEYCDGFNMSCPPDELFSRDVMCRSPQSSQCDQAEYCNSYMPKCPVDVFKNNSVPCMTDAAGCKPSHCSGFNSNCVVDQTLSCTAGQSMPNDMWCVSSFCDRTACKDVVLPDTCFIDGECYNLGDSNPNNECQVCDSEVSPTQWSNVVDGTSCLTLSFISDCSAPSDQCIAGVCVDQYLSSDVMCRPANGDCDTAEFCSGQSDECPQDVFLSSNEVCRPANGDCDAVETCSGYSPHCPEDQFFPKTTICRHIQGDCDEPETCTGVSPDCPVDVFKSSRTLCRGVKGVCDQPEYCTASSPFCPPDQFVSSNTICRVANGTCDVPEYCTGYGIQCPPNLLAPPTTICRDQKGSCDQPEYCTGLSTYCPFDEYYPRGTVCRPVNGTCDREEVCNGLSYDCPQDTFKSNQSVCRKPKGPCDAPEYCLGNSSQCPEEDKKYPSTFICRIPKGPCDMMERCDGLSDLCPEDFVMDNTTLCRKPNGDCDLPEYCDGTNYDCPVDKKKAAGVVCRSSKGNCDYEEVCNGVTDACPADRLVPSNVICRAERGACDIPEYCTGNSPICPEDQIYPNNTICRHIQGLCDIPEVCDGLSYECPTDLFAGNDKVCRYPSIFSAQCDTVETCTGLSPHCPLDSFIKSGVACEQDGLNCTTEQCNNKGQCIAAVGSSQNCKCSTDADCASVLIPSFATCLTVQCISHRTCQSQIIPGTCFIDGVCYSSEDSNPYNECQYCNPGISTAIWTPRSLGYHCTTTTPQSECSGQDTCDGAGTCIDQQLDSNTICRQAISDCDLPEYCRAGLESCPDDIFMPSDTLCRNNTNLCDVPEFCTGKTPYCPSDMLASTSTVCRPSRGLCDQTEYCDGENKECPVDQKVAFNTPCRLASSLCDKTEVCDGLSNECPPDLIHSSSYICRPANGTCDKPEMCDGRTKACPKDVFYPKGEICREANGPCDEPETCDGQSNICPSDSFSPPDKVCRMPVGSCDAIEYCTGSSIYCPDDELMPVGFPCRQPKGICDLIEVCDGVHPSCPINQFAPATTLCRPSKDSCDVPDYCTGFSIDCPLDNVRPNGYPCPNAIFCDGDETCQNGVCVSPFSFPSLPSSSLFNMNSMLMNNMRNCSTGNLCRIEICDEPSRSCLSMPKYDEGMPCYTGVPYSTVNVGVCRSGVTVCDPETGQVSCEGQILPQAQEICDNGLDDNCNDQVDENCGDFYLCQVDQDCQNISSLVLSSSTNNELGQLANCQVAQCNQDSGHCIFPVIPSYCLIDGVCYSNGTLSPQSPCKLCIAAVNQYGWTMAPRGFVDDKNICNGVEVCVNGYFVLSSPPIECINPDQTCVTGYCDPKKGCIMTNVQDNFPCELPYGYECLSPGIKYCVKGNCHCTTTVQKLSSSALLSLASSKKQNLNSNSPSSSPQLSSKYFVQHDNNIQKDNNEEENKKNILRKINNNENELLEKSIQQNIVRSHLNDDDDDDDDGLSTLSIILISVCAGLVGLIFIVLTCYCSERIIIQKQRERRLFLDENNKRK